MIKGVIKLLDPKISVQEKKNMLYRYNWFRMLVSSLLTPPEGKEYIFIVGCYSSGTTLLNGVLGDHPEISGLSTEGVFLTKELKTPEELGWRRMMHPCLNQIQANLSHTSFEKLRDDWGFVHDKSKPFYLEKSISNWARINWIVENFKQPWIIWIIRNGYPVMEGLRRRSKKSEKYTSDNYPDGFPIEICAKEWVISNDYIETQLEGYEKLIRINYEALTENIGLTINEILNRLPVKKKAITPPLNFKFQGEELPITNMNSKSIQKLSEDDFKAINEVASIFLKKWGYPILNQEDYKK